MVIWITGISGAGKTTLTNALYRLLKPQLPQLVALDGDVIRSAFGGDLGFKEADRRLQIQRLQNLAKILSEQGLVVLVAALYSHPDLLKWNRENLSHYFEIYLDVTLDTVRKRDNKGLYARVARGEMADVVGIDIPWHAPASPDLVLTGDDAGPPNVLARRVVQSIPGLASVSASV